MMVVGVFLWSTKILLEDQNFQAKIGQGSPPVQVLSGTEDNPSTKYAFSWVTKY